MSGERDLSWERTLTEIEKQGASRFRSQSLTFRVTTGCPAEAVLSQQVQGIAGSEGQAAALSDDTSLPSIK